ncbi:hypothetical protein [Glaciihabitans sp. UYNi722]|uniref:hypothetical protein n=1 Tax=Glaciihabitans sp. UYNi722 TaxID=3156344 RepID=UPI003394B8F3
MSPTRTSPPDLMPVLSRGKHHSARRGACFMEYASVLAGEKWSDHPTCTHPALGALARAVNDCTSNAARGELATLIPSVIGQLGDDDTDVLVAVRAASEAIAIASASRQHALAAGLIRCEELLEGTPLVAASALVSEALAAVPDSAKWARQYVSSVGPLNPRSVVRLCEAIIRTSVVGIAEACVPDADARMRRLLTVAIDDLQPRVTAHARTMQSV